MNKPKSHAFPILLSFSEKCLSKMDIFDFVAENFGPVSSLTLLDHRMAVVQFSSLAVAEKVVKFKTFMIKGCRAVVKRRNVVEFPPLNRRKPQVKKKSSDFKAEGGDSASFTSFEEMARKFHALMTLNEEDLFNRMDAAKCIETALRNFVMDDLKVHIVGSSASGFGWKNSDLDLCLVIKPKVSNRNGVAATTRSTDKISGTNVDLFRLGNGLSYEEYQGLNLSERATLLSKFLAVSKLPLKNSTIKEVAKVSFKYEDVYECNLSVGNYQSSTIANTRWLTVLSEKMPTVGVLASLFRCWTTKLGLTSNGEDSANVYPLILMLITFLQSKQVVPSVADIGMSSDVDWMNKDLTNMDFGAFENRNVKTEHLHQFFEFLSENSLRLTVFVPQSGRILSAERFLSDSSDQTTIEDSAFVFGEVNVQNPFVLNENVASKVNVKSAHVLRRGAQSVCRLCKEGRPFAEALYANFDNVVIEEHANLNVCVINNVPTCSFTLEPSVDDINEFGREWLQEFGRTWLDKAAACTKLMLADVLLIDVNVGVEPEKKRAKLDGKLSKTFLCSTKYKTWMRRKVRNVLLKLGKLNSNAYFLNMPFDELVAFEKQISEDVVQRKRLANKEVQEEQFNFVLNLEQSVDSEYATLTFLFCSSLESQADDLVRLCRFFRRQLPKFLHCFLKT